MVLIVMLASSAALRGDFDEPLQDSARSGALRLNLAARSSSNRDADAFRRGGGLGDGRYRLAEVIASLDAAAADDRIRAVALDLDLLTGGGQSAIANVGEALDRVRRSGKRVVAYALGYGDDSYQLAAHADEIWLDPLGAVLIAGPGGSRLYYAGLLERLGHPNSWRQPTRPRSDLIRAATPPRPRDRRLATPLEP